MDDSLKSLLRCACRSAELKGKKVSNVGGVKANFCFTNPRNHWEHLENVKKDP